jgi:hypothetical protein
MNLRLLDGNQPYIPSSFGSDENRTVIVTNTDQSDILLGFGFAH